MKFNPGRLNKRVTFTRLSSVRNEFGGAESKQTELLTTWCEHKVVNQNNQFALEAGASVLNQDATIIIRNRAGFAPQKNDLAIVDGQEYTIATISPYKVAGKDQVTHETQFTYIVATRKK